MITFQTKERGGRIRVTPYLHSALPPRTAQMPSFSQWKFAQGSVTSVTAVAVTVTLEVGTGCVCVELRWEMSKSIRGRAWMEISFCFN